MRKIFLTFTLIALFTGLSGCTNEPVQEGGEEFTQERIAEVAQCLTQKGIKMYGSVYCGHCTAQKKDFGEAFQYINYLECDPGTNLDSARMCVAAELTGVPTWEFADGSRVLGHRSIPELAELAGC